MNYGTITQIDTPMSLSDHTSTISNVRMGVKLFQKIFEVKFQLIIESKIPILEIYRI